MHAATHIKIIKEKRILLAFTEVRTSNLPAHSESLYQPSYPPSHLPPHPVLQWAFFPPRRIIIYFQHWDKIMAVTDVQMVAETTGHRLMSQNNVRGAQLNLNCFYRSWKQINQNTCTLFLFPPNPHIQYKITMFNKFRTRLYFLYSKGREFYVKERRN
jgi:hypothetical protein